MSSAGHAHMANWENKQRNQGPCSRLQVTNAVSQWASTTGVINHGSAATALTSSLKPPKLGFHVAAPALGDRHHVRQRGNSQERPILGHRLQPSSVLLPPFFVCPRTRNKRSGEILKLKGKKRHKERLCLILAKTANS